MLRKRQYSLPVAVLAMVCASMLSYCADDTPTEAALSLNNCTSCHLSQDRLVATATVEEPSGGENSGEG